MSESIVNNAETGNNAESVLGNDASTHQSFRPKSSSNRFSFSSLDSKQQLGCKLIAAGVVLLLAVQLVFVRPSIERKLVKRAEAVLTLDGDIGVKVSASGRDLSLSGYVPDAATRKRLIGLVKARRGVRSVGAGRLKVDAGLAGAGGKLSMGSLSPSSLTPPIVAPQKTGDGSADQGDAPISAVSSAAGLGVSQLEAERSMPMRRAKIQARIAAGRMTIEGTVPSEEGRDQLLGRTKQNVGEENITDSLAVAAVVEERADMNDYRRVGQLLSILSSLPGADISLNYDRGTLQITGTVASAVDLGLALGESKKLVPDASLRDDRISVGSIPPPSIIASSTSVPGVSANPA